MVQPQALCERCVCGSGLPGVTIDDDGVCSECRQDRPTQPPTEKLVGFMEEGFKKLRTMAIPYHVLVMASGGKDSSYLQLLLKETYGLRVLACIVVHPFVNELAAANAERVARRVGVDLIKFLADGEVWRRAINLGLRNSDRYGLTEMAGCTICSALYDTVAMKMALTMGIPCVVNGHDKALHAMPVLIDSAKLKAAHLATGKEPGVTKLIRDALGQEYRGSLYDPDFSRFARANWPAKVFPLTFMDYDYNAVMQDMEDRGILTTQDARPVDTNCLLVHLLGHIGFRRYDCHPYARPTSQALRRNNATYLEQFFTTGGRRLDRDEHVRVLEEYRAALAFVANHSNAADGDLAGLQSRLPFLNELMGAKRLAEFLARLDGMHDLAKALDIDLKDLGPQMTG